MPLPDVESLRFGESPLTDLNGAGETAEAVMQAVILLAHRVVWIGENGRLVYDLTDLDDGDGFPVPPMRITVTVQRI